LGQSLSDVELQQILGSPKRQPYPPLPPNAERAGLDVPDKMGRTPLHVAAAAGRPEIVHQLLLVGSNASKQLPGDFRCVTGCPVLNVANSLAPLCSTMVLQITSSRGWDLSCLVSSLCQTSRGLNCMHGTGLCLPGSGEPAKLLLSTN
jgi:hypothetical protein